MTGFVKHRQSLQQCISLAKHMHYRSKTGPLSVENEELWIKVTQVRFVVWLLLI